MERPFLKVRLVINTATHHESVAVISEKKVLAEIAWASVRDESSKLLTSITKALTKAKVDFSDVSDIVCVTGPGPFTAVRIGCATANALGFALNIPVRAISTEALWHARTEADSLVLFSAGKGHFAILDMTQPAALDATAEVSSHEIFSLPELVTELTKRAKQGPLTLICDTSKNETSELKKHLKSTWKLITETDKKQVKPLGKAILEASPTLIFTSQEYRVTPRYLRPPTITPSKKISYAA